MILVTGGDGQLATCLKEFILDGLFPSSKELDITNLENLKDYVKDNTISHIINCAAFTHVDLCESNPEKAIKVNCIGAKNLATICKEKNIRLIHISTDYVFNGLKNTPYNESDICNPSSVYGNSKLNGELEIINSNCSYFIIRTSWLYSEHNKNFVKNILNLMKSRESLSIVYDQVGSPTYAVDLAKAISLIIQNNLYSHNEIFHYANLGVASWYDLTKEIQLFFNLECDINPIESFEYPTPAKRPHYSVFNTKKIQKTFNLQIPYWKESLKTCLKKLS